MDNSGLLTEQLRRFSEGDREMAEAVLPQILPELHRIAARALRRERYVAPLSATELINEVWLRTLHKGGWRIESRGHFYAMVGTAMRHVLMDLARRRLADKRGNGNSALSLEDTVVNERESESEMTAVVEICELTQRLERRHPEAARVVDLHYFVGYTYEEIAEITGLTVRQVRHRWAKGRDWLKDRLKG